MKHHNTETLDQMLLEVIAQAKKTGIPVSKRIHPEVRINNRAKARMGCCKKVPGGFFEIEISRFVLDGEPHIIRAILAHEVLHTCPGCMNHGPNWKKFASTMESSCGYRISRLASRRELRLPEERQSPAFRYQLACGLCGRTTYRQRMSPVVKRPDLYRCVCGGKLTVAEMKQEESPGHQ